MPGTSVRNNPVPVVLTSIGVLWMMMSQDRPPVPQPAYRTGPDQGEVGEWADGLAEGLHSARDSLHQTTDSLKEGYQSLKSGYEAVRDTVTKTTEQTDVKAGTDSLQTPASTTNSDRSRGSGTA